VIRPVAACGLVRLPGWSHEPARYVAGPAVHLAPRAEHHDLCDHSHLWIATF
jgi:hypothetical protein